MNTRTFVRDFTQGNIFKQLIIFATPLFLSNLMQVLYSMVDMIVVGNVMGQVGLSGVSVGGDIAHFMTFIAMGFSSAGQVLISQYLGAGKKDKIGKFVATMFSSLTIAALAISILCLLLRHPILRIMNTPPEAYIEALNYSTVSAIGLIFIYGYNIVSAILRGIGDSKHPFIFISIAALTNIILDIVFVAGLGLGAGGAALATIISQCLSFLSCLFFLYKRKDVMGFDVTPSDFIHIDKEMLSSLVKLGVPMAIKSASIQVSKLFVNSFINSFGVAVSAFAGIANKIASVSNMLSNSLNTAGSSMVGQNIGAKKFKRVPKICISISAITFSIAVLLTFILLTFTDGFFSIFTKDEAVLNIAYEYLPIGVLIFFGSACRAPANAILNGSGNYKVNFATAIFDGIILRLGLSVLFGLVLNMGYLGFWLGDALAGFTPMVIGIVFYLSGVWKRGSNLRDC